VLPQVVHALGRTASGADALDADADAAACRRPQPLRTAQPPRTRAREMLVAAVSLVRAADEPMSTL